MKKIAMTMGLSIIFNALSFAQTSNSNGSRLSKSDSLDLILKIKNHRYDSLFSVKHYQQIINEINAGSTENTPLSWSSSINGHLIASYYRIGDTVSSNKVLKKEIFEYSNNDFSILHSVSLMNPSIKSMQTFTEVPSNRNKIEQYVILNFKDKVKDISEPDNAIKLLHFLLTDQYIRNKSITSEEFGSLNEANLKEQYSFFKKANKVFSIQEVGDGLNFHQFLLFAHDANSTRREYYLQLIKKAVEEKRCEKHSIPDFILRTQLMTEGSDKFFEKLEEREEAVRQEYNLPDYHFDIF